MLTFLQQQGMNSKNNYKIPYSNITRRLHIVMLCMCLFASIAIYIVDSFSYKIIFAIILIAYAGFLVINPHILRLVFRISGGENKSQYFKVHEWRVQTAPGTASDSQSSKITQGDGKKNSPDNTRKDEVSIDSLDRSLQKDSSMSSYRGMSTSLINQSQMSSTKKSRLLPFQGFDLMDLSFLAESQSKSMAKSSVGSEKNFQILDRKSIARKRIHTYKSESEKIYEQQLNEIKKSGKYIQSRYKIILNSIHAIVNPIINQHRANTSKIQEVSAEFLDVTIDAKSTELDRNFSVQLERSALAQTAKIPLQTLIERLLEVYSRSAPMEQTKLPLRKNKKWNDFEKKINQLLRNRVRIADNLGVNTDALFSQVRRGSTQIIEQYNNYIALLESYFTSDLQNKKNFEFSIEELSDQHMLKEFKSRIYVLYLYVRNLNNLLKGSVRIELKDFLGFKPLLTGPGELDFQISPKYSFDAYVPYYNLFSFQKGQKKCYPCEYGSSNYLSIIYFLLHCLSKRADSLRDKYQVLRMINEAL